MKTQIASPLNYAFAVGKIRALEKFLIKQEVFEEAIASNLSDALRLFVESDLYSDELLHTRDSQHLEMILDQELIKLKNLIRNLLLDKELVCLMESDNLNQMQEICKKFPSLFLQDYLMHLTDMHNIKTYLRLYILKEPPELLKERLIEGGFIKKEVFLELYHQDLSFFLNRMEYVHKRDEVIDYASNLAEGVEKLQKEMSFVFLEKLMNDFLMQVLKSAKYITFGPEPLLAYYFAKRNEINLMRMIILAKLNNVSSDLVKQRLNYVYA